MKLVLDLIAVNQRWDARTNTHNNELIVEVAGIPLVIPVDEDMVATIIQEAVIQEGEHAEGMQPLYPSDDEGYDDDHGPEVFGGNYDAAVAAPPTFVSINTNNIEEPEDDRPAPPLTAAGQRRANIKEELMNRPAYKAQQDKKEAMRELRAKAKRPRRVEADAMGNPLVSQRVVSQRVVPQHTPERTERKGLGDDIGFDQG